MSSMFASSTTTSSPAGAPCGVRPRAFHGRADEHAGDVGYREVTAPRAVADLLDHHIGAARFGERGEDRRGGRRDELARDVDRARRPADHQVGRRRRRIGVEPCAIPIEPWPIGNAEQRSSSIPSRSSATHVAATSRIASSCPISWNRIASAVVPCVRASASASRRYTALARSRGALRQAACVHDLEHVGERPRPRAVSMVACMRVRVHRRSSCSS